LLFGITLPAALGFAMISWHVANVVLGADFREIAGETMPIIALAVIFQIMTQQYLHASFLLSGRNGFYLINTVAIIVANVILSYVLVQSHGTIGAAWARLGADAIGFVCALALTRLAFPVPLPAGRLGLIMLASLIMALVVAALDRELHLAHLAACIVLAGTGAAAPEVVISCHTPPCSFRPLPLAWPGAVSAAKVYSGCPSKVAWVEPSDRLMVPKVPLTPDAVAGPFTGGQNCAHVPLQLDLVGVSGANEYSVNPLALVSTVAPPIVVVFRLPVVAAAGLLVPVLPLPLVEDVPDELHAASTVTAAAMASSAGSVRRRFRASSRVSDLIICFFLCSWTRPTLAPGDADDYAV